ncbi:hypothetical protein FVE85_9295 [Porphyridium purpureum]|uniref:Uncharacterized protein n=1 Tax=Porphyridium purpureum TaxID=35688 RepID=A0A5J4YQG7_PORPP|nr:hypothetical protein FVE85_9295 [Porphyridium purpureum]|eukprot:POR4252..scf222_8
MADEEDDETGGHVDAAVSARLHSPRAPDAESRRMPANGGTSSLFLRIEIQREASFASQSSHGETHAGTSRLSGAQYGKLRSRGTSYKSESGSCRELREAAEQRWSPRMSESEAAEDARQGGSPREVSASYSMRTLIDATQNDDAGAASPLNISLGAKGSIKGFLLDRFTGGKSKSQKQSNVSVEQSENAYAQMDRPLLSRADRGVAECPTGTEAQLTARLREDA